MRCRKTSRPLSGFTRLFMFRGCVLCLAFPALMHGGRTKGLLENFWRLVYKCVFTQCALFPQSLRSGTRHLWKYRGSSGGCLFSIKTIQMHLETMFYLLEAIGHGVLIGYNVVNHPVVFLQVNGASACLQHLSFYSRITFIL